jgi:hypothetical protein
MRIFVSSRQSPELLWRRDAKAFVKAKWL